MKKHLHARHIEEAIVKGFMYISFAIVAGSLGLILWTVLFKGLPSLTWQMLTQSPKGGYYLGKEGGILNAILGSLYLAGGGTLLALLFSLPMALYLETYVRNSAWGRFVRLAFWPWMYCGEFHPLSMALSASPLCWQSVCVHHYWEASWF
jgi:ABC-type phosphate transport system permease subunit